MAGSDAQVLNLCRLFIEVQRDGGQPDEDPDGDGNACGNLIVLPPMGQGVGDGPVSLNTQAGDKEDGTVHVSIEKSHQHLAERFSKNPIIPIEMVGYL
uniref:Uncharacterized protein n=1 Tax=Anguilla anguilla TaxID=7936 RepID=A0A0E9PIA5_ANGAN